MRRKHGSLKGLLSRSGNFNPFLLITMKNALRKRRSGFNICRHTVSRKARTIPAFVTILFPGVVPY